MPTVEPIIALLTEIDRKLGGILATLGMLSPEGALGGAPKDSVTPQQARAIAQGFAQLAVSYAEAEMIIEAAAATQESQRWLTAAEVEATDPTS